MTERVLDLFAGPGGWDEGLRALGVRDVTGVDIDAAACLTARAAGHVRRGPGLPGDVYGLEPGRYSGITGLVASPPCQGFSSAGLRKGLGDVAVVHRLISGMGSSGYGRGDALLDVADVRSLLAAEPMRFVLALRPRWVALEQVPAVLPLWETTGEAMRDLGYRVWVGTLRAERYGVPQTRDRAILLGHADKDVVAEPAATHSRFYSREPGRLDPGLLPWVSMAQALGWDETDTVGFPRRADRAGAVVFEGSAYRARDLRRADQPAFAVTEKARSWERWTLRANARTRAARRHAGQPAPTITAGHDSGDRMWLGPEGQRVRVTVAEAAVLQSFRAGYPWQGSRSERFEQIGNAMPPLLAEAALRHLIGPVAS